MNLVCEFFMSFPRCGGGLYTTYNFKLSDTGAIDLCVCDKQGTLTYPAFEQRTTTSFHPRTRKSQPSKN